MWTLTNLWTFQKRRGLHVEWREDGSSSRTCPYAQETWSNLELVVEGLRRELHSLGIPVTVTRTLSQQPVGQKATRLWFNRVPLEDLLPELRILNNRCPSCEVLYRDPALCPTVVAEGVEYRSLPPFLIRRAVLTAVGMMQPLRPLNLAQPVA